MESLSVQLVTDVLDEMLGLFLMGFIGLIEIVLSCCLSRRLYKAYLLTFLIPGQWFLKYLLSPSKIVTCIKDRLRLWSITG